MITCKPAQPEDIPVLLRLEEALIRQYEDLSAIDVDHVLAWCRRKLEKRLDTYRRILRNGDLAGFYSLVDEGDRLELDSFYILPRFLGQGIGTSLLGNILKNADKPIYLYVFTENQVAIRLYQRLGFTKTEAVSPTRCIMHWER